jgi:hypothetical protein
MTMNPEDSKTQSKLRDAFIQRRREQRDQRRREQADLEEQEANRLAEQEANRKAKKAACDKLRRLKNKGVTMSTPANAIANAVAHPSTLQARQADLARNFPALEGNANSPPPDRRESNVTEAAESFPEWTCLVEGCGTQNNHDETYCGACGNIQKIKKGWGGTFTFGVTAGWKCNFCLLQNNEKDNNCSVCEVARGTKYQPPELSAPPQDAVGAVFAGSTSIGISALTSGGFQFGAPAPLASAFASPPAFAGPTGSVLTSGGFQFGAPSALGGLSPSGLPNAAGMARPPADTSFSCGVQFGAPAPPAFGGITFGLPNAVSPCWCKPSLC